MYLVDILNSQLGPEGIEAIGRQLGVDPATAQNAVASAVPMLTGVLAQHAARPGGADALHQVLDTHGGGLLDQLGGLLGGGGGALGDLGGGLLGSLLGGRQDAATAGLANATGLNSSQAFKLLALLAPLVLAALSRHRQQQGDQSGDLASVLATEHQKAQAAAPPDLGGLAGMLDMDHDGNPLDDLARLGGGLLGGLFGGKR